MTAQAFTEAPIPVDDLEGTFRAAGDRPVVTLQGVIRRDREGADELDHVVYEAEPVRARDEIDAVRREVHERWRGAELLFRHRLGRVRAGETSVFIAVAAARREDALAACHHVMDRARKLPGLRQRDVFRGGASRICLASHVTLILSDDVFSLPQS